MIWTLETFRGLSLQYRSELDGLRAVAILPVIFFHAGFDIFSGGFVGVDVFFVISGYLIAALLMAEAEKGPVRLGQFYARRARRILPALFCMVILITPVAWVLMMPEEFSEFAESLRAVALGVPNLFFLTQVGYFGPDADMLPLLHTWSLGVELHFYLLFPLAFLPALRRGRGFAAAVIVLLALGSFAFSEWAQGQDADRNFLFSGSRFWEFFLGSLCALLPARFGRRAGDPAAALGLLMILWAVFRFDQSMPFPGLWTLVPLLGAALVLVCTQPGSRMQSLLSLRPLVGIGMISYSLYLWHQPLFVFLRLDSIGAPDTMAFVVATLLAGILSVLSWKYVERPFRRASGWAGGMTLMGKLSPRFGLVAIALCLTLFGTAGKATNGFRDLWMATSDPQESRMLDLYEEARQDNFNFNTDCEFRDDDLSKSFENRIASCHLHNGKGVLLIGDSHAEDLFGIAASNRAKQFIVGVSEGGCRVSGSEEDCDFDEILNYVSSHADEFEFIVYEQAGFYLFMDGDVPATRRTFTSVPLDEPLPDLKVNTKAVEATLQYLAKLNAIVPVIWLGPRLEHHLPLPLLARTVCGGRSPVRKSMAENIHRMDGVLAERSKAYGVAYIPQSRVFDLEFPRDYGNCNDLFWRDGDHLSDEGQFALGQRVDLVPVLRRLSANEIDR